jgi:carotenoid cleavage dioxygenase-like enzyme
VPRTVEQEDMYGELDEDDGYLMTYTHELGATSSQLKVWDAKSMLTEPLCVVHLPQRVPFGFHGHFLSATEIQQQPSFQR